MSANSTSVRCVEDLRALIKERHQAVTNQDLEKLIPECKRYEPNYPNIAKDIIPSIEAVYLTAKEEAEMKNKTLEEHCTSQHFVNRLHVMINKDVLKGKTIYAATNESIGAAQNGHGGTISRVDEIKSSELMTRLMIIHKEAHPEFGKALHTYNQHLNFDDATTSQTISPPDVLIGNFTVENFLNVKIKDFHDAFRTRLESMQKLLVPEIKRRTGKIYTMPTRENSTTFDEPRFLIGRLTYEMGDKDTEPKFSKDRIIMECLVTHQVGNSISIAKFPLNFSEVKEDYFLFPNMVIATEVTGDIFLFEEDAFKVHRIIELESDKDLDPDSIPHLPTRFMKTKQTILFFKGPFTIEGNYYFGGLTMIEKHINYFNPQHVIIAGPFIPEEQLRGELQNSGREHKSVIEHFLTKLIESTKRVNPHFTIVQDFLESSNIYPIPVPSMVEFSHDKSVRSSVTRVGSPCLLSFGPNLRIAISSGNFQVNTRSLPIQNNKTTRYSQILRSFISQKSLHCLFPGETPFDVTQQEKLFWPAHLMPTVWLTPSSFTQFLREERGIICANPGSVFDGENFKGAVKIQADGGKMDEEGLTDNSRDKVRVEIIKF
jgi:hypothetical protein